LRKLEQFQRVVVDGPDGSVVKNQKGLRLENKKSRGRGDAVYIQHPQPHYTLTIVEVWRHGSKRKRAPPPPEPARTGVGNNGVSSSSSSSSPSMGDSNHRGNENAVMPRSKRMRITDILKPGMSFDG